MTADECLSLIASDPRGVVVKKLYRKTRVADCRSELWDFLKLPSAPRGPHTKLRYLFDHRVMIGDFPFDVWVCEVGKHSDRRANAYGKSFEEAVERAFAILNGGAA